MIREEFIKAFFSENKNVFLGDDMIFPIELMVNGFVVDYLQNGVVEVQAKTKSFKLQDSLKDSSLDENQSYFLHFFSISPYTDLSGEPCFLVRYGTSKKV